MKVANEMKNEILCIIPARGGSKGIPRKNLVPVGGIPLLAHSIRQARQTPSISRIIVSTDDDEIAGVAREWGAEVVDRPAELSTDFATSESALLHVLDSLQAREQYVPDYVVFLQATSPVRRHDDIGNAIKTIIAENADSLFSGTLLQGFIWGKTGEKLRSVTHDYKNRKRRQMLTEDLLMENGSLYLFKPRVLRETGNRLGGAIAVYNMDWFCAYQIDEIADVAQVERILRTMETGQTKRGENVCRKCS